MPPRILHINTSPHLRGGENQTLHLIRGLALRGWENHLACLQGSPLSQTAHLPAEIHPLKLRGELNIAAGMRLGNLARRLKIPLLHAHTAAAHSQGLAAKFISGAKLVVTRRVDFPLKSLFSALKYRRADHIIAISRKIMEVMLSSGVPENKISLVHSGVVFNDKASAPEAVERLRKELNLPARHKIIGISAALAGHKDHATLLRAFKVILEVKPDCVLLALGEGDELPRLQALAEELNISEKVKFLGYRRDIADFWGLFDLYVQSSKMEGLCTSLIEAMNHRLPIAATDAGGIPDLIENGVTGLAVPAQNPPALAQAALKLLNNTELGSELGEAAAKKSLEFTAEKMVEKTEAVYRSLLRL